jgi:hypothetical protein
MVKLCIVFVVWLVLCSERCVCVCGGGGLIILACGKHDRCGRL